jgi:hypothetical protein
VCPGSASGPLLLLSAVLMVLSRHTALLRIMSSMRVRLEVDCVLLCSSSCTSAAAGQGTHTKHLGCRGDVRNATLVNKTGPTSR